MSELRFVLDRPADDGRRVLPVVDGRSLVDLAGAYEVEHGFDVPGGYAGLPIDAFVVSDLERYLTGGSGIWPGDGRIGLLGCDCGE